VATLWLKPRGGSCSCLDRGASDRGGRSRALRRLGSRPGSAQGFASGGRADLRLRCGVDAPTGIPQTVAAPRCALQAASASRSWSSGGALRAEQAADFVGCATGKHSSSTARVGAELRLRWLARCMCHAHSFRWPIGPSGSSHHISALASHLGVYESCPLGPTRRRAVQAQAQARQSATPPGAVGGRP
jgi:hypothetical protein